eukprot:scaffold220656_cov26-Tisochrysis_lutea.AAC.1
MLGRLVHKAVQVPHDPVPLAPPPVLFTGHTWASPSSPCPTRSSTHAFERTLRRLQHKPFMEHARTLKASRQAFNLLRVLPPEFCFTKSFTMALDVCAEARDLATGTALFDMAERTLSSMRRRPDLQMMTTYIKGANGLGA